MPLCTHKGCGKEFDTAKNDGQGCSYHTGAPVFHEGLKSWSCCSDVNKPVLDFDEFMKIPGCTIGQHSDEVLKAETPKQSAPAPELKLASTEAGKETYTSGPSRPAPPAAVSAPAQPPPAEVEEEEDDLSATVPTGTKCRRNGCNTVHESDELHRIGDGEGTVCTYHPKPPIFHEGSKGYLCCKRRVLEFDEFLKIEGCKKGRHVFVPKAKAEPEEQFTDCRIDHYQTPSEVHVSIFAKKADQETSTVRIEQEQVHVDLYLPASKRFRKTLHLFGPIEVDKSSFKFYGTKVELQLKKSDTRSWTLLEKTDRDLGNIAFTFGVGGRTGTIGAKDLVLDEVNKARA